MQETQQKKRKTSSQLTELDATWLPDVEAIQRDFRRNRPSNRPAVPDIYDVQFVLLQNYTVDILNQQFFAYDNGVSLFCTDKGFYSLGIHRTGFWTEHLNQAQFKLCHSTLCTE